MELDDIKISRQPLDTWGAYVITSGDHLEIATKAARAGARILQYRQKEGSRQQILETAKRLREITSRYQTRLIINDYIDIAHLVGADGAHLGQEDLPISEARKISPIPFIIGQSTHSLDQALTAQSDGADYIGIGPVFATPTKQHYPAIGTGVVKNVIKQIRIPVVAIGGLNLTNMGQLHELGVRNVAMVRQFESRTAQVVKAINQLMLS